MKADNDDAWTLFLEVCLKAKTLPRLRQLFDLFFTLEEKEKLSSRIEIIRALLEQQMSQREIANHFHVSISQITRGSNALKIIDPSLKHFLESTLSSIKS